MDFRPLKRYGQHFLQNTYIAQQIVNALQIESDDALLEIGPGEGILSRMVISQNFFRFIAVEIDKRLAENLTSLFSDYQDAQLEIGDIQEFSFREYSELAKRRIKVFGNIPYNITSPIIFRILDNYQYIGSATLMIQKEVAERLTALPGTKEYGILSVAVSNQSYISRICNVKSGNFFPKPEVDSSVIRLDLHANIEIALDEFRDVVRRCFQTRRKTLKNNLSRFLSSEIIHRIKSVSLSKRPEELTLRDYQNLVKEIRNLRQ